MIPAQMFSGTASPLVFLYVSVRVLNGAASLSDHVLYGGVLL
jgi:hypothetical protein